MAEIALTQQWWQHLSSTTQLTTSLFCLISIFSLLFMLMKLNRSGANKLNLLPSPPKLPIIGHLHLLGALPHRSLHSLSKKYGPIMLLQLDRPTIVISSIDLAKEILKTHDAIFANPSQTWAADILFYGGKDMGRCPYGEYWRQARRICATELLSPKRVQSFNFIRLEEVAELVEKIHRASLSGTSIVLGEEMVNIAYSIISRCVLGQKYDGGDGDRSFGELARTAMELMMAFSFRDMYPYLGWMDVVTGLAKRIKETHEKVDVFLDKVIEQHQNSKVTADYQFDKSFIGSLLHLQEDGALDFNFTQDNIKALLLDMFVGGIDTISTTMEWAMLELVKHPSIMKEAQEVVRRVVGKKLKVDEDDLNQMYYLKCVIKETLRLHPPAPLINPRESSASTMVAGYDIPSKMRVFVNAWAIQRDPNIWDMPEEFKPERFSSSPVDFNGQDFQFLPFGSGRRICPGVLFGIIEVELVLANLLYWFNWKLPGGECLDDLDMSEVFGLVTHKKIPLQLVPILFHSP
ncbi:hypothetical protein U1Q18_008081 [Sarracenia purpurea var. burkii]